MAGGGGERRGRRRSRGPLHPRQSPVQIDTMVEGIEARTNLCIAGGELQPEPMQGQDDLLHLRRSPPRSDPKVHGSSVEGGLCFLGRKTKGGPIRRQTGHRRTWWDRGDQREVIQGVDFAPDSQDGGGDEFYYLPESGDEVSGGGSIDPDDGEVIPETEPQELEAMEDNDGGHGADVLVGPAKRLRKSSEDGALLVADLVQKKVTSPRVVTSDAETDDENIDSSEDIVSKLIRIFVPDYSQACKRKRD